MTDTIEQIQQTVAKKQVLFEKFINDLGNLLSSNFDIPGMQARIRLEELNMWGKLTFKNELAMKTAQFNALQAKKVPPAPTPDPVTTEAPTSE